jgi:hypothetical protein
LSLLRNPMWNIPLTKQESKPMPGFFSRNHPKGGVRCYNLTKPKLIS